jgi:3-hydroxyacyl-CoA dehydrogenase
VDIVVRNGFGRRRGLRDLGVAGWDLISAICTNLFPRRDNVTDVQPFRWEMVARGKLGTKKGKGFYRRDADSILVLKGRIAHTPVTMELERDSPSGGR